MLKRFGQLVKHFLTDQPDSSPTSNRLIGLTLLYWLVALHLLSLTQTGACVSQVGNRFIDDSNCEQFKEVAFWGAVAAEAVAYAFLVRFLAKRRAPR